MVSKTEIFVDLRLKSEVELFCRNRSLSAREQDIILLLVNGFSSAEDIARRLRVSISTVKNHLHSIFQKTEAKSKAELLAEFIKTNWANSPDAKALGKKCKINILVADDDGGFHDLLMQAQKKSVGAPAQYKFCYNGQELINVLESLNKRQEEYPDLILLDLYMPVISGFDALKAIKNNEKLRRIPVIAITNSDSEDDVRKVYETGAHSYFVKPGNFSELVDMVETITTYWSGVA